MLSYSKDPNAKLPFSIDWAAWAAAEGDTVATATWTVPTGLVKETNPAESLVAGKATVWISGGTAGETYAVTCRITTTGGRIDDRTITVIVYEQ